MFLACRCVRCVGSFKSDRPYFDHNLASHDRPNRFILPVCSCVLEEHVLRLFPSPSLSCSLKIILSFATFSADLHALSLWLKTAVHYDLLHALAAHPPPTSTFLLPSAALNPAGIPPSAVICLRASEATVRWGWWARRVLTLDAISWGVHPRHPRWPVRHNAVTTNKHFTSLGYFPFNLWHNRDSIIASSDYIYTHHRLKKRRLQPATRGEWQ